MYASQNELLTKQPIKRAQKWRFSLLKKPQTPNEEHDYHPTLPILTILFCAWKQYHQFTHSFCRDPVGAGKILPRGLCEFWKEKESLKSDISTSGCTQEGQVPPRKATPGLPPSCVAAVASCHLLLFLHTLRSVGWSTKDRSNNNLWGQSKKGGTSI